jgi:hypothetical protein
LGIPKKVVQDLSHHRLIGLLIGNQYEADISNSRAIAMLRGNPAELLQAFIAAREWVGLTSPIERARHERQCADPLLW